MKDFWKLAALLLVSLALTACIKQSNTPRDPFEKTNRVIFKLNEHVDKHVLKPIAQGYRAIVPAPIRTASTHFFDNLALLPTVANDALQGELTHTMKDSWRFIINSTLGVGGTIDVATQFGIQEHYNDFGLTLAKLGDKNSPYFVIPFIGPSTMRDGFGMLVDNTVFSIYPYLNNDTVIYSLLAYRVIVYRAQLLESEHMLDRAALDRYTFMRDAYLQYRDNLINAGQKNSSEALYVEENQGEPAKK